MAKWLLKKTDANIELMAKTLGIGEVLSTVLANRGIRTKNTALRFLNPVLSSPMYDASKLKHIDKAVDIIVQAVSEGKKIAIYGDYDVDGVMSATILYKTLKDYGAEVIYYIPHRELEGFGLNIQAIAKLNEEGINLLITCDNGISAINEIEYAKSLGMSVIVIDHHEPEFSDHSNQDSQGGYDILPAADAIVDPKQKLCEYPFKSLCAAGLSYKFAKYFYERINAEFIYEDEFLMLAALATICDIVDLFEENRAIVKCGLELINSDKRSLNAGLRALLRERSLEDKKIGTFEVGFMIGPCINATGRLETALTAMELFTSSDGNVAELAGRLVSLNEERKAQTAECIERITLKFNDSAVLDKVIIIYDELVHESIAGIVAGRIKDMTYHPAIVLTKSSVDGIAKGSARSIEGYNIFAELYKCKDLFERFGGHEMAAGLSLACDNIEILRQRINSECPLTDSDFEKIIRVDMALPLHMVTFKLAEELARLEPSGKGNKEAVFGAKGLVAEVVEAIGENKKTLRFTFPIENTYRKIKAVCFNKLEQFVEMLGGVENFKYGRVTDVKLDIIYQLGLKEYNHNTYLDMKIIDFRINK